MRLWSLGRRGNLYLEQGPGWAFLLREASLKVCGSLPPRLSKWLFVHVGDRLYDFADARIEDMPVGMSEESFQALANKLLSIDELKKLEEYEQFLKKHGGPRG